MSPEEITAALRAKKEVLMQEVYTIMSATLGTPPRPDAQFTWEYYENGANGSGRVKVWSGTPVEFYAQFSGKYKVGGGFFLVFIYLSGLDRSRRSRSLSSMTQGTNLGNCIP
jgi:bleomycin hydrolase